VHKGTAARKTLAVIRIANGAAGLLAPEKLLGRLGVDTAVDRAGTYPFRMFGIRTVLIGLDLLLLRGARPPAGRATRCADSCVGHCCGRCHHRAR